MELSNHTEVKVQLKGAHLCCGGCADAIATALEGMPGAAFECDMENGTVTLTATDVAVAQKVLAAIVAAGLHGETGSEHLAMKIERNLSSDKAKKVAVSGIHNCCQPCCEAIEGAIGTVEGVTGHTAQPGQTTFEVTGNFDSSTLARALNAAGFHAKINE